MLYCRGKLLSRALKGKDITTDVSEVDSESDSDTAGNICSQYCVVLEVHYVEVVYW